MLFRSVELHDQAGVFRGRGVAGPQLCGSSLYLASPRFVLGADFPEPFRRGAVAGAEPFFTEIALARAVDPPRMRALQAFDEFFFIHAKGVYRRYEFATMK